MARYIDAEKLMRALGIADECKKCTFCIGAICTNESDFVDACTAIAEAPTADVAEVKHGKWEMVDEAEPRRYGCSRCKCLSWTADNYCSYCGAKMEMEQ